MTRAGQDISPLLNHIKEILCEDNEVYFNYFLDWMAHVVQKPEKKTCIAVVFRSEREGAGKGIVINKLMNIIGDIHSTHVANSNAILGEFNSTLSNKVLVNMDEAVWGGDKKGNGILLSLITEPKIKIRLMRTDAYSEDSFHNLMLSANANWVFPAAQGTRRWCAFEVNNKWAGVSNDAKDAYFSKIAAVSDKAFAHYLYTRDISEVNIREAAQTELLQQQVEQSYSPIQKWWSQNLHDGGIGSMDFEFGKNYSKESVYLAYKADMSGDFARVGSSAAFWKKLKQHNINFIESRLMEDGMRCRFVKFEPLETARESWAHHMGTTPKWDTSI